MHGSFSSGKQSVREVLCWVREVLWSVRKAVGNLLSVSIPSGECGGKSSRDEESTGKEREASPEGWECFRRQEESSW